MYTALSEDKEMKRVNMQNNMILEIEQRCFKEFHGISETFTTVKKYYKLRGICNGQVNLWYFNFSDSKIDIELERMREFHKTLLAEFTDEQIYQDENRTFYLRGDQDRPTFDIGETERKATKSSKSKGPMSFYLRKAILINSEINKPYIKRKFTKEGMDAIEKKQKYFNKHLKAFEDIPYRRGIICTHDSNNKNFVDLMVNVNFDHPTFSKEKREKEVMSKNLQKESLFEFFTVGTSYVQLLQSWYTKTF